MTSGINFSVMVSRLLSLSLKADRLSNMSLKANRLPSLSLKADKLPSREADRLPSWETRRLPNREASRLRSREAGRLPSQCAGRLSSWKQAYYRVGMQTDCQGESRQTAESGSGQTTEWHPETCVWYNFLKTDSSPPAVLSRLQRTSVSQETTIEPWTQPSTSCSQRIEYTPEGYHNRVGGRLTQQKEWCICCLIFFVSSCSLVI